MARLVARLIRKNVMNNSPRNMSTGRFVAYVTRSDMPECGIDLLKTQCDVKLWKQPSPVPRDEFLKCIAGVDGIYCTIKEKIDKEALDAAGPQLKVVATISVGHEHIDLEECRKRGVKIGYTPHVLTDTTAELTMALLLATCRRLPEAQCDVKHGKWVSWASRYMTGQGLSGATIGIVGFGRIGQAVARRIKSFNTAKIIYFSRSEREDAKEIGAVRVNCEKLLMQIDFVIVCAPLMPETREIFNENAFEKMKRSAVFVNISRGALINHEALINALKNNIIWGAGLDVTDPEPLPLDSPLFKLKNCVILPHIGSATIGTINVL